MSRMLKRAFAVAAVVGTVLLAINQGDALLRGNWQSALWWKIPLTYAVPFLVSLHSSAATLKSVGREARGTGD